MKIKLLKMIPIFALAFLATACEDESKKLEIIKETFTETATETTTEDVAETSSEIPTEMETKDINTKTDEQDISTVTEATTEDVAETSSEIPTEMETKDISTKTNEQDISTVTETTTEDVAETSSEIPTEMETKPVSTKTDEQDISTAAETTTEDVAETFKETPAAATGSLGITYNGKKIMLNTDINAVALGDADNYSEAPSCNYNGLDKVFTYGGVSIYTYPHASGDLINEIEVNDDSVEADKGVKPIGKSIDDIKSVYGEPSAVEGFMYKYTNGNCYTYFYADNDIVSYWGVVYEG